jgi:hypothetical protein
MAVYFTEEGLCDNGTRLVKDHQHARMYIKCFVHEVSIIQLYAIIFCCDHLYDLVVKVPGYRSRSPGSISGATRFSDK